MPERWPCEGLPSSKVELWSGWRLGGARSTQPWLLLGAWLMAMTNLVELWLTVSSCSLTMYGARVDQKV